jgi:hypothetical protein
MSRLMSCLPQSCLRSLRVLLQVMSRMAMYPCPAEGSSSSPKSSLVEGINPRTDHLPEAAISNT